MGQQSLIYSFVSRGTVILSEYTEFTGNFTSIASQCLQKLPASNNKFTYNCDGHTFNYLVENGFTYCVVAVEAAGRQIPIAFLERVKDDFNKRYGGGKAATAVAKSLNKEFGSKLKEHMQYCVDHPEEISKLAKVKAQVSEVKGVMMENIEKVLDRGEKIEVLVDKTENLRSQNAFILRAIPGSLEINLCIAISLSKDGDVADVIIKIKISIMTLLEIYDGARVGDGCGAVIVMGLLLGWWWFIGGLLNISRVGVTDERHGKGGLSSGKAQDFRQQGTKIRRKMWFQNMKIKLIVFGILVLLILTIILSVCGGFKCT
ncbi:vesicle-associated membrane protein 726 [Actinidia rufa]|uniref:Vesicle-associated membrane protein 726 n=1 Tax=Actinidia rufa TaxID=165716 RepID=A0A7J0GIW4_9ERIC|nr:vesicle-associated membrane protein 726 [Actinidia rufa]